MNLKKTEEDWKKELTPEQYRVLRKKGTEIPFTGKLTHEKAKGMYSCAGCGQQLFASDAKFDSGTGWPSFDHAIPGTVEFVEDNSMFIHRIEAVCSKCGGHLGHIFDDGPTKTKKRFCINSCSLKFKSSESKKS